MSGALAPAAADQEDLARPGVAVAPPPLIVDAGGHGRAVPGVFRSRNRRPANVRGLRTHGRQLPETVRGWLRSHSKGRKRHDVLAHHRAAEAVEAYVNAA